MFPEEWTPQDIVHAIHQTIEDPEMVQSTGNYREARKWVDGVLVTTTWEIEGQGTKSTAILRTAFPVRGNGVRELRRGKMVEPTKPYSKDQYFTPVKER